MINTNVFEKLKAEIEKVDLSKETKSHLIAIMYECIDKYFKQVTINGKSLDEVITILNGLEVERQLEIKMCMENLSYLFKKVCEQEQLRLREQMKNMIHIS